VSQDLNQARRTMMGALTSGRPLSRARTLAMIEALYKLGYDDGWDAAWVYHRPDSRPNEEEAQ
jgi:hypothetical protein